MLVVTNTVTGVGIVRPVEFERALSRKCILLQTNHDSRVYRDADGNRYRVSVV